MSELQNRGRISVRTLEHPTVCKPYRFTLLSLTTALANADNYVEPYRGGVPRVRNQRNAVGNGRGVAKSAAAEMLLHIVRDSPGAIPPLRFVAEVLYSIILDHEVRSPPTHYSNHDA